MMSKLDEAIESNNGVWPLADKECFRAYGSGVCIYRQEFEKRAKERGWVNGYKWGKEYQCDGKKPNLPDDVVIDYLRNGGWHMQYHVDDCYWGNNQKFRIVDDRYKPVEPENQSTDWHERGELPPAGVEFLFSRNGTTWEERLMLFNDGITCLMAHKKYPENRFHYKCNDDSVQFRPIKTDRERFIDAVNAVLGPEKLIAIQLFDAGFKGPEDKK